jgi:hypothetical protein
MRAHITLVLALSMASPAFAEPISGRTSLIASLIDSDALHVDAKESGQLCDDGNETNYRCGVGTEWAVTDRVSIKSEAHYLRSQDAGFIRTSAGSGPGDTKRIDHVESGWVGRIGVNFKLGGMARQDH